MKDSVQPRAAAVTGSKPPGAVSGAHQAGRVVSGGDDDGGRVCAGNAGPLDWLRMAHTVFGTTLIAAGTSALNHYFERDTDALMRRTASRPLPSGQLKPARGLWFGVGLIVVGTAYLALATNVLATLLGHLDFGHLSLRLHAAQAQDDPGDHGRRVSRRCASADRLGGGARHDLAGRLDSVRHPVPVAIPAF